MPFINYYLVAFIVFFLIDIVWLGLVAKKVYRRYLGSLMGPVKWVPAILFYLLFIGGVVFFVISPAVDRNSWSYALLVGMLFGFITYQTYDLTNLATLKGWSWQITIIDLVWGSFLGGMVAMVTFFIVR